MPSSEANPVHRQLAHSSRLRPYWMIPPVCSSFGSVHLVTPSGDALRAVERAPRSTDDGYPQLITREEAEGPAQDLMKALVARGAANGGWEVEIEPLGTLEEYVAGIENFAVMTLVVPRSERWREAVSTALLGDSWCEPLARTGHLPLSALGALKAEARTLHRQLVPIWRRGTRHGRVLSLDAALGDGLSFHDLVAADVDLLARVTGGVFEDERLNQVLRGLDSIERQVVFAYAEGEGTTWTEAAVAVGAVDPEAFGERVRRKAKRQAAEQQRRIVQRREDMP